MTSVMAVFGKVDSFELKSGDFVEYTERVEQFFIANEIEDANKKTRVFITVAGAETYSLLHSLLARLSLMKNHIRTLKRNTEESPETKTDSYI